MVKLGTPHLAGATFWRPGQEQKSQCKSATPYLTMYLGLFYSAFSVPRHLSQTPWRNFLGFRRRPPESPSSPYITCLASFLSQNSPTPSTDEAIS